MILFAALAALTYLSISWSVQPANSWVEANRTLAYLAAFGAAVVLARIAPARWPALVWAVGTVAVVVSGYALLAKVFPGSLNAGDQLGRLRVPFSYWNATGLMAGLGLPACLWAGARPNASRAVRALAVPAIAVLLTVLILSYSRGALIAVVVGLGAWFVLVPYRLRATLLLALGAIGGIVATGWALSHHAITHDGATLAARTSAGHEYGVVLLATLAGSALIGLTAAYATDRLELPEPVRRRIGTALVVLVALVPVAAVAGMAASSRGLTGEISHVWHTLTSANATQPGNNPGRIAALGNSRPLYWSEGLKVGEHALLAGAGAGGFDTAHTRYSSNTLAVAHAHSFLIETFADFGLIGLAVSLALFVAWVRAVMRTLGLRARWPAGAGRRALAAARARAPARRSPRSRPRAGSNTNKRSRASDPGARPPPGPGARPPPGPGARSPRGRARRPVHAPRRRRDVRRLLADRLDLVRPRPRRPGTRVRRLARRPRTAKPAGRESDRAPARQHLAGRRGRGSRHRGGNDRRGLVRVAAAPLGERLQRGDHGDGQWQLDGRARGRPERYRGRSGLCGAVVGAV